MPVVHLRMNVELKQEQKNKILLAISHLVADAMHKPLADVMVICSYDELTMGGQPGPATFVEFKCVSGLSLDVSRTICEGLYNLLHTEAGMQSSRIYINFFEVRHVHAWRFNGNVAVCAGQNSV
jgi:phenylpyruvate tautomerase PptA (4-oxalocrotonate tautomerase family)